MILQFISRNDFSFDLDVETISGETLTINNQIYPYTFDYTNFVHLNTYEGIFIFKMVNNSNYIRNISENKIMNAKRKYNKNINRNSFRLNYDNSL